MLLEIDDLRGGYGEVDILQGISLRLGAGEVVTLAGSNGSGKSTIGRAIMGLLPRVSGRIVFEGTEIGAEATHRRIGRGIFYVPQVANVFPNLSVLENLLVLKCEGGRDRIPATLARFPALAERQHRRAGTLSGGERQQLAIARGLVANARLMILDEPTANLAPKIIDEVLELIAQLPGHGVATLLIEQRAREAFAISTRGYVMHVGAIAAEGTSAELLENPRLGEMFFGMAHHAH